MKLKDLRDYIISLIIGCTVGTVVTLPFKIPAVQDYIIGIISKQSDVSSFVLQQSNADHGDTLEEVINGIRNEKYEYAAVFQNGYKIFEVTSYDEHHCAYVADWSEDMAPDTVEVHNHPLAGYSFSYLDLNNLCSHYLYQTMIIVTCDTLYTLSAPDGWPTTEELRSFFTANYGMEFDSSGNMSIDALQLVDLLCDDYILLDDSGMGLTSKTIGEFAEYFDLIYTVEYTPGHIAMPED